MNIKLDASTESNVDKKYNLNSFYKLNYRQAGEVGTKFNEKSPSTLK